jgi:gas vesicle protein
MASRQSQSNSGKKYLGYGLLTAGAVAAAAGAYFFYGSPNSSKNRKRVKGWMLKARGELMDQIEKHKEISEDKYYQLVDRIVGRYKNVKNATNQELKELEDDLKSSWTKIERAAKKDPSNQR